MIKPHALKSKKSLPPIDWIEFTTTGEWLAVGLGKASWRIWGNLDSQYVLGILQGAFQQQQQQ